MLYKIGLVVLVACIGVACQDARSTCEKAQDRLAECEMDIQAAADARGFLQLPLELKTCSGALNTCVAECVANATCAAIEFTVNGHGTDPEAPPAPAGAGEFAICIQRCIDLSRSDAGPPGN